ncbi:hypothetical protein R6Q59_026226 [Mikania micrantha]
MTHRVSCMLGIECFVTTLNKRIDCDDIIMPLHTSLYLFAGDELMHDISNKAPSNQNSQDEFENRKVKCNQILLKRCKEQDIGLLYIFL